jgi:hypothetical protein
MRLVRTAARAVVVLFSDYSSASICLLSRLRIRKSSELEPKGLHVHVSRPRVY